MSADEHTTKRKVMDALKETLEGRLAVEAHNHTGEPELTGFSRSGGSYHSRSGHDFSRAQVFDSSEEAVHRSESANFAFAREFLARQG